MKLMIHIRKRILIGVLLSCALLVAHADSPSTAQVSRFIKTSNIEDAVQTIPQLIQQQAARSRTTAYDQAKVDAITNAMLSSFDPNRALNNAKKYVLANTDKAFFVEWEKWLSSPTASLIRTGDLKALRGLTNGDLEAYVETLSVTPPTQARVDLIRQIDLNGHITDRTIQLLLDTAKAVSSAWAKGGGADLDTMRKIEMGFRVEEPMLYQMMSRQFLMQSLYAYQGLTDAQLAEYVSFLSTDTGKRYVSVSMDTVSRLVTEVTLGVKPSPLNQTTKRRTK